MPSSSLLLDQSVIAGIGNIYADESCFRAGIRPDAPASSLSFSRLAACAPRWWRCLRSPSRPAAVPSRITARRAETPGPFRTPSESTAEEGKTALCAEANCGHAGLPADDHLLPDVPEGMSFCPASSPGTDFRPQAKRDVAVRPERALRSGGAAARRRQCLRPQGAQATADCLFEQRNQCASSAGRTVPQGRAGSCGGKAALRNRGAISCPPHDRREHCARSTGAARRTGSGRACLKGLFFFDLPSALS